MTDSTASDVGELLVSVPAPVLADDALLTGYAKAIGAPTPTAEQVTAERALRAAPPPKPPAGSLGAAEAARRFNPDNHRNGVPR